MKELRAQEVRPRVGAVILAAGESKRFCTTKMGDLKQCLPFGETTILGKVVGTVLQSSADKAVLVVGHRANEVKSCIGAYRNMPLQIVVNRQYKSGLSSSIKTGLRRIMDEVDAVIFVLGDQPNVSVELINKLIQEYKSSGAPLCVPVYDGKRGNPVLLGSEFFPDILKLKGDIGARELVEKNFRSARTIIVDRATQFQVNTLSDYKSLCTRR